MKKFFIVVLLLSLTGCDINSISYVSNPIAQVSNPILQAIQKFGLDEKRNRRELQEYIGVDPVRTEWCAAFINSVLEESGITSNKDHDAPLTARSFLDWGTSVKKENIKAGDIVIFPRGDSPLSGHAGFYIRTLKINGVEYYVILGGNQTNKVSIVEYRASTALSIRRSPS
tara:strand:+ start:151 stop:663 length:513 start_codon:yes stop_codon:yes gene_type:complete